MGEAFRQGGWGMYPTLFFGIVFLGAAIGYARSPGKGRLLLPTVLGVITFTAGALGFFTGLLHTLMHAIEQPNMAEIIAQGTAESLNNVCFALVWNVLGGCVIAIGAYRRGRMKPEAAAIGAPVDAH